MAQPQLLLVAIPFQSFGKGEYLIDFGYKPNSNHRIVGIDYANIYVNLADLSANTSLRPDIILVNETNVPHKSVVNALEQSLPADLVVHLVGHRENFDEFCPIGEQLSQSRCFSRMEASKHGLTFSLLQNLARLRNEGDKEAYTQTLAEFFQSSRLHCIEACRREMLNEWDAKTLFAHRDPEKWIQLGYAWQQLLVEYPEIPKHLGKFTNLAKPEQDFYARTQLADYLYGAALD